jgi:hypothetical protein
MALSNADVIADVQEILLAMNWAFYEYVALCAKRFDVTASRFRHLIESLAGRNHNFFTNKSHEPRFLTTFGNRTSVLSHRL